MNLNPDDPIIHTAVFGKVVENFLNTELGKYLVGRAEREVEEAIDQLKSVAPWRRRRITELQNEIKNGERFQAWLADAIIEGQQALKTIEGDE